MILKTNTRGFTLIELLVVIAIIGILASVVLASLNTARSKGQDANIQATINNARSQAEIFYDDNGRVYSDLCADPRIMQLSAGVTGAGGTWNCDDSDPQAYSISSPMIANNANTYCVDSIGFAGIIPGAAAGTSCQ